MRISLRALEYVVTAAETGSVSEAAARLNVSQPSVSGAIAQFESDLKLTLFVRHHARGVSVTPSGQRIITEARALLNHAADFSRAARAFGSPTQGDIAVGCFSTLAMRYMPPLLAAFAASHPAVKVALHDGDQSAILEGLQSGRTEYALSYGYALPEEIEAEPLGRLPPHLVLAATHPLARRKRLALADLIDEPFLLLDLPFTRDYFLALFAARELRPKIVFRSGSYELIRGLVGRGRGYTILNVLPLTNLAQDGSEVATVPIADPLPAVEMMGLRLARHPVRPAVAAFASLLRDAFAPGGFLDPAAPARP
jgi:DNA-binding transcriptional LysR family regulator